MTTYLGLDLGSKTLGVSISTSGLIASPLETFRFQTDDYEAAAHRVIELVETHQVSVIVLGLPKHMNNDLGIRGEISMRFKAILETKISCEVILWDERMSTKSALHAMRGSSIQTKKQNKDTLAAVLILQNYLDYKGVQS